MTLLKKLEMRGSPLSSGSLQIGELTKKSMCLGIHKLKLSMMSIKKGDRSTVGSL